MADQPSGVRAMARALSADQDPSAGRLPTSSSCSSSDDEPMRRLKRTGTAASPSSAASAPDRAAVTDR